MADGGRYAGMSHRELYDQLFAGKPNDIENTVAAWKSAERQADTLAGAVDSDLDKVLNGWEGSAGTEFRDRVGKISSYSRDLSNNFLATHSGLSQMSAALSDAQAQAETPEEHDDNDKMLSGALDGAAKGSILGPIGTAGGAFVGGFLGHSKDEEEKERARERMAQLVAGVASQYELADQGDWRPFDPPPPGLPEGDPNLRYDPTSTGRITTPSLDPGTGPGGTTKHGSIDTPAHVSADPGDAGGPGTTGGGTVSNGTHVGTQLQGAGDGALAAGAVGLAGGLTQLGNMPGQTGTIGTGLTSSTLPPGGVLGGPGGTNANTGTPGKVASTNTTTRNVNTTNAGGTKTASGNGNPVKQVKPPTSTGQAAAGTRGAANTQTASAGNKPATTRTGGKAGTGTGSASGRGGSPAQMGAEGRNAASATSRSQAAAGARGNEAHDEEVDEHSTWLTEDDLVWRKSDDVPPGVLGG